MRIVDEYRARASTDVRRENRPTCTSAALRVPALISDETDNNYIYEYSLLINAICGSTIWHGEKCILPVNSIDFDRRLIKILVLYMYIRCSYSIQEKKKCHTYILSTVAFHE